MRAGGTATLLLGTLLLASCAEKEPHFDQELELRFADPSKTYEIELSGGDAGTIRRPITPRSRRVIVRITGEMVKTIHIRIYNEDGTPFCETDVEVTGPGPYEVTVTCTDLPPPPPPPDASAPPDAGPDAGPDTTPDTGPSPACQGYCQTMRKNCPMVYPADDDCLATCAAYGWPVGRRDFSDNSIECRHERAIQSATATSGPLTGCYQAGPSGGRYCGTLCQNYCQAAQRACPELLGGDLTACLAACKEPAAHPAYRSDSGNTLECKIFWMGEALKMPDAGKTCARLQEQAQDPLCHD